MWVVVVFKVSVVLNPNFVRFGANKNFVRFGCKKCSRSRKMGFKIKFGVEKNLFSKKIYV